MERKKGVTRPLPGEGTTPAAPRHREDLTVHELDDEALIFDGRTGDTHRLNCTAFLIWQQCDGNRAARDIAEHLTERYEVSAADARTHVERMLAEFTEKGLIVS